MSNMPVTGKVDGWTLKFVPSGKVYVFQTDTQHTPMCILIMWGANY
jgi:hypothetical protein